MGRRLSGLSPGDDGFTLLEVLVAGAIFAVVIGVSAGVLTTMMRNDKPRYRDRVQQMQLAANQIGEDMAFANWTVRCLGSAWGCAFPADSSSCPTYMFDIRVPQPMIDQSTVVGGAPGYLKAVPLVELRYTYGVDESGTQSTFVREVVGYRAPDVGTTFVRQVLATGLVPCSPSYPDQMTWSGGLLSVNMQTRSQEAMGVASGTPLDSASAEVRGTWFVK